MGFLRRDDFRRTFVQAQYSPRPAGIEAVRQFTLGGSVDYIETVAGVLETRTGQASFGIEFENSDRFSADVQSNYELLKQPFEIAPGVTIPVGGYNFQDYFISYLMGGATAGLGQLLRPGRRVLQRGHHCGRIHAQPGRDYPTVLD